MSENSIVYQNKDVISKVLAGILVFTDKVIDEELGNKVKEWLMMTKVARLFEEEKEIALAEKDAVIAKMAEDGVKKDAQIEEKDLRIKELEERLKKLEG